MFQLEVLLFFGVDLGTVSFVFFNMYIYVTFLIICIHVVYDNCFHYVLYLHIFIFCFYIDMNFIICLHVVYDIHVHIYKYRCMCGNH